MRIHLRQDARSHPMLRMRNRQTQRAASQRLKREVKRRAKREQQPRPNHHELQSPDARARESRLTRRHPKGLRHAQAQPQRQPGHARAHPPPKSPQHVRNHLQHARKPPPQWPAQRVRDLFCPLLPQGAHPSRVQAPLRWRTPWSGHRRWNRQVPTHLPRPPYRAARRCSGEPPPASRRQAGACDARGYVPSTRVLSRLCFVSVDSGSCGSCARCGCCRLMLRAR